MSRQRVDQGRSPEASIVRSVPAWFKANGRPLPWRGSRSGYTALVSEAMLQQTQVARVIDSYKAFIRRFPTVSKLAAAHESDVLAMWRGLGYYRRARSLHAAAKVVVSDFKGAVPRTAAELRELPGVGRYTAGAIASIVFDEPEPIVDGNIRRVLLRIYAKDGRGNGRSLEQWAWQKAAELASAAPSPGHLNEGLMELGAVVCTPRAPRCHRCPVARICQARLQGMQTTIPRPRVSAKPKAVHHHAVIVRRRTDARYLFEQRPQTGMWSGMWQTPTVERERPLTPAQLRKTLNIDVDSLDRRFEFIHQTTHRTITFHVFAAIARPGWRGAWLNLDEALSLPMSNAQRRILRQGAGDQAETGLG